MSIKFTRQTPKQIKFAAGMHTSEFKIYPEDVKKFFNCCQTVPKTAFDKMPKPGPHDWLCSHKECGQSVKSLTRRSMKAWPHATYDTINIVPCGEFIEGQSPPLEELKTLMELWFCCKCTVSKIIPLEKVAVNGLIDDEQLLVRDCADYLKKLRPGRKVFANIMVTMTDLTPGEGWNFVFGQASLSEGWGVFSFARYNPNFYNYQEKELTEKQQKEMLRRACRTMVHECGHILGFKHCIYYHCLMNGSNGDHEVAPFKLCPICLQKLYLAIGKNYKYFDIQTRYENLQQFYMKHGWKKETKWISLRLGLVQEEDNTIEKKVKDDDDDEKDVNVLVNEKNIQIKNEQNNDKCDYEEKYDDESNNDTNNIDDKKKDIKKLEKKNQKIKAKTRLIVRKKISKKSEQIGEIDAGKDIEIPYPVEIQRTSSGTIRVPLIRGGWVTARTKFGKDLIGKYTSVKDIPPKIKRHLSDEGKKLYLGMRSPTVEKKKKKKKPETAEEVQASLNETMASLKATQEGLEKTLQKNKAVVSHSDDLEKQWKDFQDKFRDMNDRMISKIAESLKTDKKMHRHLDTSMNKNRHLRKNYGRKTQNLSTVSEGTKRSKK